MNAGKYDKKINIYKKISEEDADGFKHDVLQLVLSPYASVKTTKGQTIIASNSDFEKAYTNFTIRYPSKVAITRDMVIIYKKKTYTIEYLNNVNENDTELEIQAKEVTK